MNRAVGTIVRGLRAPIFNQGDDIIKMVTETVLSAADSEGYTIEDKDIVAITESVVARTQGNYANIDQIAKDIKQKFTDATLGVVFPILSRNRFAVCLKGIAKGIKKVVLLLSYPSDEVGNHLIDMDSLDQHGINPYSDTLTEEQFRQYFGYTKHPFTGIDYIQYYRSLVEEQGAECEIIFSNNPVSILQYTKNVLVCDIHTRNRTKRLIKNAGGETVYGMDDILTCPVDQSGFNEMYGLLGSNKASETSIKLFPRDCYTVVSGIQNQIKEKTGKTVEVLIYGDGAFKDPIGKIWELADPVVSPAYTSGLEGTPNEVKLKYLADNDFKGLHGEELRKAISDYIKSKKSDLVGNAVSQGTTPRRLSDLVGSLCDLTSGSGDKGTPIVYIQRYFTDYTK